MNKLRPDQEEALVKGLEAIAEYEQYLAENNITREEDKAAMRQFREDCIYMGEMGEKWAHQYANLWVAIYRKEVIAAASTHQEILKQISSLVQPPGSAVTRFVAPNPPALVV